MEALWVASCREGFRSQLRDQVSVYMRVQGIGFSVSTRRVKAIDVRFKV